MGLTTCDQSTTTRESSGVSGSSLEGWLDLTAGTASFDHSTYMTYIMQQLVRVEGRGIEELFYGLDVRPADYILAQSGSVSE